MKIPSFEKPALAYNGFSSSITNWSSLGDVGVQNLNGNTGWFSSIPDGNQVAQITQNGQIYQTLSYVLSPGVYDLSANVGSPTAVNDARPFSLELWAGSTQIAQVAATSLVGSFPRYSTSYTASTNDPLLGQTLNIIFRGSTSGAGAWTETSVDDVELNYIASNAPPAVLIPIQNPSFENIVLSNPGAYSTNITPWIGRQPPLAADLVELSQNIVGQGWVSNDSPLPAGYNVAALSYDDSLTQTLTNNLAAGVYNLSVYVGNNTAAPTTFPFQLQLWAGNTLLSQTSAVPTGTLVQYSTSYTASNSDTNLGAPLKIAFQASVGENYGVFDETLVDGFTLRYLAGAAVSTVPTNISYSVSGNQLTLSWPADHTGWSLLMQTNHLATGISTNTNDWARVANSASTNQVTVTINPAKQTEFYRLVYP